MITKPVAASRRSLLILTLCIPMTEAALAQFAVHPSTGTSARPQVVMSTKGGLQAIERRFIERAAMSGLAEIEMGRMAQQKAFSGSVKQYAQGLANDHTDANQKLEQLATAKRVVLPDQPSPKQQNDMKMLQSLAGPEFDRQYMSHMVDEHEKNIFEFDQISSNGQDPELKAYAVSTLSILRQHLQDAQQVRNTLNAERQSLFR